MGQSFSSSSSPSSSSSSAQRIQRRTSNTTSPSTASPSNSASSPIINNNHSSPQSSSFAMEQDNISNTQSQRQQQQQPQQTSSPSSRVLRSTTERRRRNNLFSNFYPLLSRNSSFNSSSNTNDGNNSSELANTTNNGASSRPGPSDSTSQTTRTVTSWPERPPSRSEAASPGVVTRSSSRSPHPTGAGSGSSSRTPRGLSRVQRMYDEQSVQSTRSSSRASSVAANSPLAQPISSSIVDQTVEYMDIDPESVSVTAQHSQSHSPNVMGYSASSQLDSLFDATMAPISSTISTAAPIRESGPRTRSALQELSTPSASSVHTTSAMGSESLSLSGLASPRGDTSISSSLFPIRPDPDDENDDMDHDVAMDRDSSISPTQPDHGRTQIHQHNHTTDRGQGRRFPGPELFAQIMLSLQESATTSATSGTPSTGTVTSQNTAAASADNDSQQEQPGAARRPGVNPLGRTRLRSSSMRGLFGYQPTSELADAERSAGSETSAADNNTTAEDTNTDGTRTDRNADRLALQIPFFLRLLAEISRMSQATNEDDPEQTDATERPSTLDTMTDGASQHTQHPPVVTHGTDSTAEPSAENGSNPRSRRPNTTIRLIQFGHGIRHARPQSEANVATTEPTGTAATSTDEGQGETEGREGQAGTPGEEINETFIMFLSGPPPDGSDDNESNGPAAPGSDDPESARNRPRHRSPWIVLTLSGAYLNSMMAAGEGEGGSSYDDLWMLANLIGPARPVTTTQEAIDNAGFEVGQFEQALQGMRNVTTLGDSSKCLVCMSEYEEGEDMRALKCHHGFHQACIDKWLTTGANKCPVCRAAAVVTTEPEIGINHANTTPSL